MNIPPEIERAVKQHIGREGLAIQAQAGKGLWIVTDDEKARYIPAENVPSVIVGDAVQVIQGMMETCDYSHQGVVAFVTNFGETADEQTVGLFDLG